ncbi:MAG: PAS domain S-box protein [Bacteroidales bacterium]|nr:PAS domain S-box protein [Bacteroidales bacterium]
MKDKKDKLDIKYLSPAGFSEVQWYAALISVLAMLLIGWTSIISLLGLNVTLSNIAYMHRYIFVWIFDMTVVALLMLCLYLANFRRIKLSTLASNIESLQSQIDSSIVMAGKIGAGQSIEGMIGSSDSDLHKTLLKLGKNLMETKEKESQFSWVTRGKEKVSDILRSHNKIDELAVETLIGITQYYEAVQGAFFILEGDELRTLTQYAYNRRRYETKTIKVGTGLIGAAAYERQIIYRTDVPEDYFTITSGMMGEQKPRSIIIIPLMQEDVVQGVIELAFFKKRLPQHYLSLAEELGKVIGATIYNLKINERTAQLLRESQEMTATLKKNEEQLQQNALEMLEAKENVEMSNRELAVKIQEVENGQKRLQALLTNASEFISIYNEDREVTFESPSIRRILGYEPNDTVHGMDEDMMTPKGFRSVTGMFDYLLDTPGGEMTIQYTYLKKNGDKIFLETQGKNLLHDPAIRGLIFNTRDITERIRAEREERMKSRMQSLSENSPDMIIRTSTNGKIVYVNPAASKFLQREVVDLMSMKINELDPSMSIVDFISSALKLLKKTHTKTESELQIELEGEERIVEVRAIPEFGESGDELESVLFQAHDVTQMKKQEEEIKEKNKSIQDSINYALRIQKALLPEVQDYQKYFPKTFMMYFPKNTVSGDFPWFYHFDNVYYIAAVDCTGHGVPGALLSLIGTLLLNNIVETGQDLTAAQLLDKLHAAVRRALKQDDPDRPDNGRDGMDLGLCRIDTEKHELQFAGAHRPLYYMRGSEFTEYKGSRKGIGGIPLPGRPEPDFENNVIEYQPGDRFYVFSDGLPDQLDGQKKKKYQTKRFKELLDRTAEKEIKEIYEEVHNDFINVWMRNDPAETEADIRTRQVDDVLLIGVEL